MVSIVIGLVILAALSTLFVNQSKIRAELEKSNRMIDNGRYAMELISENLQLAGFYDNYAPSGAPTATPDPCSLTTIRTATTNLNVLLNHVQGYDASDASSDISAAPCSISAKTGSDILVLRRASTSSVTAASVATGFAAGDASVTNTTYLQVSNCATDSIPSYKIASGSTSFTTYHKKNCTSSGTGVGDGPADLRPFLVQTYFISPDNVTGDGIPTLKRVELDHATATFVTTPLVEGIEYMQFDYGLDTTADGAPDSYIAAPLATDWPNVVSVKINIIARNLETTR
ncbi:MAG TPA: PilW family protein, partial [Methylotenera sp.]|nr:PilW family protein [Methylotenera sp.]